MKREILLTLVVAGAALAAPPSKGAAAVTYNKDVLPILQNRCQGCHRPGEIGPMSFLSYKETRPWAKGIKQAVLTGKMPPWFAEPGHRALANERRLTQAEINTLAAWADSGAPEGDPKDAGVDAAALAGADRREDACRLSR